MYELFNETDGVYASPDAFKTRRAALAYARRFRQRFATQGYYLTSGGHRIPVEEVKLAVVEMGGSD